MKRAIFPVILFLSSLLAFTSIAQNTSCSPPQNPFTSSPGTSFATTLSCGSNACPSPSNLAATNITANSAVLSWTGVSVPAIYNLSYRKQTTGFWTLVIGASSPFQLDNLTCNTTYEWQVQSVCENSPGTLSLIPWSERHTFTTPLLAIANPNPADDYVAIHLNSVKAEIVSIEVRDITGNLILSRQSSLSENANSIILDTGSLKDGIYYAKIISSAGIQNTRLIIKH